MTQMTLQVRDELAARIRPMSTWLPTILELGLIGFKTLATRTAAEVLDFLRSNPSREALLGFHVSDNSQDRVRRLLTLNEAGLLGEEEQRELDELQKIEHVLILLKAQVRAEMASA